MPSWYADVPKGVDFAWCPQGCGGTTEDPYGGPCKACWRALDDEDRWPRSIIQSAEDERRADDAHMAAMEDRLEHEAEEGGRG